MKIFKKLKSKTIREGNKKLTDEEVAVITATLAIILQPKQKSEKIKIPQRTPYSFWKMAGIKDQMVYGRSLK